MAEATLHGRWWQHPICSRPPRPALGLACPSHPPALWQAPVRGRWWCVVGAGDDSGSPGGLCAAGKMPHPCSSATKSEQDLMRAPPLTCLPASLSGPPASPSQGLGKLSQQAPHRLFLPLQGTGRARGTPQALNSHPKPPQPAGLVGSFWGYTQWSLGGSWLYTQGSTLVGLGTTRCRVRIQVAPATITRTLPPMSVRMVWAWRQVSSPLLHQGSPSSCIESGCSLGSFTPSPS